MSETGRRLVELETEAAALRESLSAMSWAALDLAQHLACANDLLREEDRPAAYKRAERMAYAISNRTPEPTSGIQLIDHRGLTNVSVDDIEGGGE